MFLGVNIARLVNLCLLTSGFFVFGKAKNDVFIENIGADIATLNPHVIDDAVSHRVVRDIFEGLVSYDNSSKLILTGAERYTVSEDGKIYTFYLRKNAKWSNGDLVTANDYVFSFRRAVTPSSLATSYLDYVLPIKNALPISKGTLPVEQLGVYAGDKFTLRIELEGANIEFLDTLSLPVFYPIHVPTVKKYGIATFSSPRTIMCNGPYVISSWVRNSAITLKKNEHYWDKDKVQIKNVKFLMTEDGLTDLNIFKTKGEHVTSVNIPILPLKEYRKDFGKKYVRSNVLCQIKLMFNMNCEKFKDKNVRKALAVALDKNKLNSDVLQGATVSDCIVHEDVYHGKFKNDIKSFEEFEWRKWNAAKKKEYACNLLKKAGYSSKKPLVINISTNNNMIFKNTSVFIQDNFKKVFGDLVVCNLEFYEWKTYLKKMNVGDFEIMNCRWIGDFNLPSNFTCLFVSDNPLNFGKYKNAEYDKYYKMSISASSIDEYLKYQHMCNKIATSDFASIPYSISFFQRVVSDDIKGYVSDEGNVLDSHSTMFVSFK